MQSQWVPIMRAHLARRPCSVCGKIGCSPMEHAGWDPGKDPQR